jgi:hypothetical protein
MKLFVFSIGDGKMGYVDLMGPPSGAWGPGRIRVRPGAQRKTEEREFETETLPPFAVEITGQVPPFIAKTGVWSVIFREAEYPFFDGLRIARGTIARQEFGQARGTFARLNRCRWSRGKIKKSDSYEDNKYH